MTAILGFLTSKVAGPLFGVAALGLLIGFTVLKISSSATIASLHSEIDDPKTGYKAELATASANQQTLKGSLDQCNVSVDSISKRAAAAEARAQGALDALAGLKDATARSVAAILGAKASSKDACKAADALILEQAR